MMRKLRRFALAVTILIALTLSLLLAEGYFPNPNELPSLRALFAPTLPPLQEPEWWKEAVIYEIYPASFSSSASSTSGIGDIPGIISKLDYLHDIGVDVIHICPFYQSPHVDMGYDISNYEKVHEPYGNVGDVQKLIDETHQRGMKIIFDLVINHSSDQHEWFLESRSSKNNPKRDWYFWRPAKVHEDGTRHPPNNWRSHFGGSAWTWDEKTQEYYLHVYAPEMPDFNWEKKETRKAIYETAIISWLGRGIDGFRIDTVNKYSKDVSFPDADITDPGEETQSAVKLYNNGTRIHEFLGEMKDIFERYGAMTVGELSHFPRTEEGVMQFVSAKQGQLNMVFNYEVMALGQEKALGRKFGQGPFNVPAFKKEISRWQDFVHNPDAWGTLFLENHDSPRSISRFVSVGSSEDETSSGKLLALLMSTLTGTLFLYQGQELGMSNIPRSWPIKELMDIRSQNMYKSALAKCGDDPACLKVEMDMLWDTARDHARMPMQWTSGPNAGFANEGVTPWMRKNDDWKVKNVEAQSGDPESLLEFWKKMLKLRKEYKEVFVYGRYNFVETEAEELFAFTKESKSQISLTIVNMSGVPKPIQGLWSKILRPKYPDCMFLLSTHKEPDFEVLKAWEGHVFHCNK